MKVKEVIRYRLAISHTFPATHPRRGELTFFNEMILGSEVVKSKKIHTIRGNYDLWAKRFEKINKGEAVLELYQWSGKPFKSPAISILQLGKDDGIGIQKLLGIDFALGPHVIIKTETTLPMPKYDNVLIAELAKNDGLSLDDFKPWFKNYVSEPMAIIHFTKFRY